VGLFARMVVEWVAVLQWSGREDSGPATTVMGEGRLCVGSPVDWGTPADSDLFFF
jgi:hypothetical protein